MQLHDVLPFSTFCLLWRFLGGISVADASLPGRQRLDFLDSKISLDKNALKKRLVQVNLEESVSFAMIKIQKSS